MFRMVLNYLLAKLHSFCGCTDAYIYLCLCRNRVVSFERFFEVYVIIWSRLFPGNLCGIWLILNFIAFIDSIRTIVRHIITYWKLGHCKLQRRLPWLMIDYDIDPSTIAQECFIYQNRDLRLVVDILQEVAAEGRSQISFYQNFALQSSVDPGVEFFNLIMGRPTYGWNYYFFRAATEMRATFRGERIFVTSDKNVFFSEERYPGYFYDETIRKGDIRRAAHLAVDFLQSLPYLANPVNVPDYTALQADIRNVDLNNPQFASIRDILVFLKTTFRCIPDPYITREEILDCLHSRGIEGPLAEMYCYAYSELGSEIMATSLVPRSLEHLCRCRIRNSFYMNWRYPKDMSKLDISTNQKDYLSLKWA